MIYHLFEYLRQYDIPGQGLFTYLSFRAMLTSITAMFLSFFAGRKIIKWLQRKQIGETIRDLGLEGQMQKKGTPTMGGVIIILAIVVPVLLFCNLRNIYIQLLLLTTVWCGALGFADDYIKVFKHNKEGLHPKAKLVCQLALGLVIGLAVCFSDDIVIREKVPVVAGKANVVEQGNPGALNVDTETLVAEDSGWKMENVIKSTKTTIPFVKDHEFDYKCFSPFKGKWGWYSKRADYMHHGLLQRNEPYGRNGRARRRDKRHSGCRAWNTGLAGRQSGELRLSEHHVYSWKRRDRNIHVSLRGRADGIPLVQFLSSTGVHG